MRSPLRSPAQVEGSQGFLPQPEKDLERRSSTRLEARFPSHDSRAMTRSPSPLAWRPDFPGAPRGLTNVAFLPVLGSTLSSQLNACFTVSGNTLPRLVLKSPCCPAVFAILWPVKKLFLASNSKGILTNGSNAPNTDFST